MLHSKKWVLGSVFAYAALQGTQFGQGGTAQPADLGLAALLAAVALHRGDGSSEPLRLNGVHRAWLLAAVWTLVVDGIALGATGSPSLLAGSVAYWHAWFVLTLLAAAAQRCGARPVLQMLAAGAMATLLAVLARTAVGAVPSVRFNGGFADSNQMGYCALLAGALVGAAHHVGAVPGWAAAAALVGSGTLVVLSASRAAQLGWLCLAAGAFVRAPKATVQALVAGTAAAAALAAVGWLPIPHRNEWQLAGEQLPRVAHLRGYERMVDHPQMLLLGAGEGANERFASGALAIELHSALGSWLFCFGLPGWLLLAWTARRLLHGFALTGTLLMAPALAYGLFQQGLRFRMFWLLVAAVALAADVAEVSLPRTRTATPPRTPPLPAPQT